MAIENNLSLRYFKVVDFLSKVMQLVLMGIVFWGALLWCDAPLTAQSKSAIEKGFRTPPQESGIRCYWWWLEGNVTKDAIRRDLEEMHAKGFSGALIFDAGGSAHRGNQRVPAGPMFGSEEWLQLFRFAVEEAARLGLELSLNIQSGWNLGGPMVTPEYASKMLTYTEQRISGPTAYSAPFSQPLMNHDYYEDIVTLAYRTATHCAIISPSKVYASSSQTGKDVGNAFDGNLSTFWVSGTSTPAQGPSETHPQWLEVEFDKPRKIEGVQLQGRTGYGPKHALFQIYENGNYKTVQMLQLEDGKALQATLNAVEGTRFRLLITDAYDRRSRRARNVQVSDFRLMMTGDVSEVTSDAKPLQNLEHKAVFRLLSSSAPSSHHLLYDDEDTGQQFDVLESDILDISDKLGADGVLRWNVPAGEWIVLRFGMTLSEKGVSTSSGQWTGLAIDYLSPAALERYWNEAVVPILDSVRPHVGAALRYLHTDSYELGPVNWTPNLRQDFLKCRGYDLLPYLPVIAGKIVNDRQTSNSFLADFRRTLADAIADHYALFSELAQQHGLGIHPQSGGPHAGPLDALQNLGRSQLIMGESWIPSPHRPRPVNRLFIKQAFSAANIYGSRLVGSEIFTSIGPHWTDVPWKDLKPTFDRELCSGLNLVFVHTSTCSPKEMGLPGQEYFAGTHFNPNITWWDQSPAFIDYMNRCQFVMQQGKFVADVLYYNGNHIPNFVQLKAADPAGALPGYDYDITNEEAMLLYASVKNGRIVYSSSGMQYRLLVLPGHRVLSHKALQKVEELVRKGATVLGYKPQRSVSLMGAPDADKMFVAKADKVWGEGKSSVGLNFYGQGKVMWGKTAREALMELGVIPDLELDVEVGQFVFIHRTIEDSDVYFISNQTSKFQEVICSFRVVGKQPELWDPITGQVRTANSFTQLSGRTTIPLQFDPYGSVFVVFHKPILKSAHGDVKSNYPDLNVVKELQGPWQVAFDPAWGGPALIQFESLGDWTQHDHQGVRHYSGKADYQNTFTFSKIEKGKRYWLELNKVEDIGIAAITLNGHDMGVVWTKPFRVEITDTLKSGQNSLEIAVVNSWRNRLVGDRGKPQDQRYTKTNINIRDNWQLLKSGLIGPVIIKSDDSAAGLALNRDH